MFSLSMRKILYSGLFLVIIVAFSSCSKVTMVTKGKVTNYYGLNFIDVNSTDNLKYIQVKGFGLVDGVSSLTLGYIDEETILADPRKCQVVLIVDSAVVDMNSSRKLLGNICIVRKKSD